MTPSADSDKASKEPPEQQQQQQQQTLAASNSKGSSPSMWQLVISVFGAAFGVQTEATRQRDFNSSSPLPYIIAGLIFTVLFVLTIIGVVSLVLA
jgi:p-aminobenzoyl-glutamate transporter AbgT|tara:strand:- start:587 stop:871 length:285 start_codon:yes stop_codon:yes gene_type:complete